VSRPRKYTDEQLRAMRKLWNRQANRKRRARLQALKVRVRAPGPVNPDCEASPRPPAEVLAERDYRNGIRHCPIDPPSGYEARYAQTAAKLQAEFAALR